MLSALLGKMLRGYEVGPATAIGQDYKVLELKGVVAVRPDSRGFYMKLLKRDIGEIALQVLTEGDASAESLRNFPGASVSRYDRPEQTRRVTRRRLSKSNPTATRDVLVTLRSRRK